MTVRETKAESDYKKRHGLADHVRVAMPLAEKSSDVHSAREPRGLGDQVARFTSKLGIKQCAGCLRRQRALNQMFPSRKSS